MATPETLPTKYLAEHVSSFEEEAAKEKKPSGSKGYVADDNVGYRLVLKAKTGGMKSFAYIPGFMVLSLR